MSKDKGSKNHKKKPADKSSGKKKVSAYKSESKGKGGQPAIEPIVPITDPKKAGGGKKQ